MFAGSGTGSESSCYLLLTVNGGSNGRAQVEFLGVGGAAEENLEEPEVPEERAAR